jgi:menaquinone-dependent protoporphyrinogen oxidase
VIAEVKRVLVTAASRHNGTREIAEAIAAGLAERGIPAEARAIEDVTDLRDYSAVVLGSAIYMNRWLAEARRFVQVHASELLMRPVWLFSSGPLGPADHLIPPSEAADIPVVVRLARARGHCGFGGRLELKHLRFNERAIVRTIHAPEEDRRDWAAVDRFAGEIAEELLRDHLAAWRWSRASGAIPALPATAQTKQLLRVPGDCDGRHEQLVAEDEEQEPEPGAADREPSGVECLSGAKVHHGG